MSRRRSSPTFLSLSVDFFTDIYEGKRSLTHILLVPAISASTTYRGSIICMHYSLIGLYMIVPTTTFSIRITLLLLSLLFYAHKMYNGACLKVKIKICQLRARDKTKNGNKLIT